MTQEQFPILEIQTDTPPLRQDDSGAVRIGDTRVLLELVIRAFQDGATPEAIVQRFSTTTLADIYSVIAYYLRHRALVERYLTERERQAEVLRQDIEARQGDLSEVRRRLSPIEILKTFQCYERVVAGESMPGVFVINDRLPVGHAIEEILLVATCSEASEWTGKVLYLPL